MELLMWGLGVQSRDWHVLQQDAAGYSRIYYILSGRVTYGDDGGQRPLHAGRLYVFPARKPYRIDHDPEFPIECLWFHTVLLPYDVGRLLEFDPANPSYKTLWATLEALICEQREGRGKDRIFALLAESLALLICRDSGARRIDPTLIKILEYIQENLFSPTLTVESVSKAFNYSAAHFIRLFRHGMGMTPHRYCSVLRLTAATRFLTEGKTVSETAMACGYTDIKTFSRAFKRNYGVSPSSYLVFYDPRA